MVGGEKTLSHLASGLSLRPLKEQDLPAVLAIEQQVYNFPWSEQIFKDCLYVGYSSWALMKGKELVGYALLSIAVEEAHILNICVAEQYQGQGYASQFVSELFNIARDKQAAHMFLEVRPSNIAAIKLYAKLGFNEIGRRKAYYPSTDGREDALVLSYNLV